MVAIRSIIIVIFFPFLSGSIAQERPVQLQVGDLVFQNTPCGPLCDAINAVTEGYKGRNFSHVAIVVSQGDSLAVIEAIGDAVQINSLGVFLSRSNETHLVGRLKKRYRHLVPGAIRFAKEQLGVPYDDQYLYDNGKYYCSELVYDAFKWANAEKELFHLYPMSYREPGSQDFFPVWAAYFEKRGIPVPEGEPGCNPGSLSREKSLRIIGEL